MLPVTEASPTMDVLSERSPCETLGSIFSATRLPEGGVAGRSRGWRVAHGSVANLGLTDTSKVLSSPRELSDDDVVVRYNFPERNCALERLLYLRLY